MTTENIPVWKQTSEEISFPHLNKNLDVDVAIIGGGITGMMTAYMLCLEGKTVALLEAGKIAEGSTGYSTGNLYIEVDEKLASYGLKTRKNIIKTRSMAIDLIEQVVNKLKIDCDFKRTCWNLFSLEDEIDEMLEKEKEALKEAGVSVRHERKLLPFQIKAGIVIENQAQFNPMQFVKQLAKKISGENCQIFENTIVHGVEQDGDTVTLHTSNHKIKAKDVIMATHTPKGVLMVQTMVAPYREYGIAFKLKSDYPETGMYWSTEKPHHSIRTFEHGKEKFLIVISGSHKTGQHEKTEECYKEVSDWTNKHFSVASEVCRWSAQNYKPADGLPYIGKSSIGDHVYYATGFATDGLTWGTLASIILTDQIMGRKKEWHSDFDSQRFTPLASAKDFIKENINVLGEYLKDIPMNVDADKFSEIKAGQGKTIEIDGEKYAAYRDENKNLHVVSAVCTHMSCIVNWNQAEKTWDCPCHGSRFNTDGEVLEGPAYYKLRKKSI